MKTLLFIFTVGLSQLTFSQTFELNKDLDDDKIAYQGVLELDSLSKDQLMTLAKTWSEKTNIDQTLENSDDELSTYEFSELYKVEGKKSQLGKAYDYRFTSALKLEFKDQKLRYTLFDFKKKSSPGEPGCSMESYIENYNKKGVSIKSKEKDALRLDAIELELHEQVNNVIYELKNHFTAKKDDW